MPSWSTSLGPESEGRWKRSPCLGRCERGSGGAGAETRASRRSCHLARPGDHRRDRGRPRVAEQAANQDDFESLRHSIPQFGDSTASPARRIGRIDPESLEAYRASGGYLGSRERSSWARGRHCVRCSASKLMGRGGAAFPTGRKWDAVAKAPRGPITSSATPTSRSRAPSRIAC